MGFTAEAIALMKEILRKVRGREEGREANKTLKSLRSRARNAPSLIMSSGLPQTLAFIASKSDARYYEYLVAEKQVKGKLKEGEEAGYSAYLYVIMKFLTQQKVLDRMPSSMEEIIDSIERLDRDPQLCSIAQSLLNEFLLEFKKVAEALIEEG